MFTNWTPLDDAYVDNLLKAMKGEAAEDGLSKMVGEVVRSMEKSVKKFSL